MPVLSFSGGKGMHVLCLYDGPVDADMAIMHSNSLLRDLNFAEYRGKNFWKHKTSFEELEVETYPKQDSVDEGGYGNLLRLPLGIHRKTGNRGMLVKPSEGTEFIEDDPVKALTLGSLR
jgi:hypothetical protein